MIILNISFVVIVMYIFVTVGYLFKFYTHVSQYEFSIE